MLGVAIWRNFRATKRKSYPQKMSKRSYRMSHCLHHYFKGKQWSWPRTDVFKSSLLVLRLISFMSMIFMPRLIIAFVGVSMFPSRIQQIGMSGVALLLTPIFQRLIFLVFFHVPSSPLSKPLGWDSSSGPEGAMPVVHYRGSPRVSMWFRILWLRRRNWRIRLQVNKLIKRIINLSIVNEWMNE